MTMSIGAIVGAILMIIVSIIIICAVAAQNPKNGDGVAALGGGSTFASTNDRSVGGMLNKLIKLLVIAFFVLTIVVFIFAK